MNARRIRGCVFGTRTNRCLCIYLPPLAPTCSRPFLFDRAVCCLHKKHQSTGTRMNCKPKIGAYFHPWVSPGLPTMSRVKGPINRCRVRYPRGDTHESKHALCTSHDMVSLKPQLKPTFFIRLRRAFHAAGRPSSERTLHSGTPSTGARQQQRPGFQRRRSSGPPCACRTQWNTAKEPTRGAREWRKENAPREQSSQSLQQDALLP